MCSLGWIEGWRKRHVRQGSYLQFSMMMADSVLPTPPPKLCATVTLVMLSCTPLPYSSIVPPCGAALYDTELSSRAKVQELVRTGQLRNPDE